MRIPFLLVMAVAAGTALGEEQSVEERLARFRLFNNCEPMSFTIESLPTDAVEIGLTENLLSDLLESRLRAARLYDESEYKYLYLNVNMIGQSFSFDLEYSKILYDPVSGYSFLAKTWSSGVTGTSGGNAGYIREAVSEQLDRFILEYLRVNESSCN